MSAGLSLIHLVHEWKSHHSMSSEVVSCPTTDDCFRDIFASLPNVSSWPGAAVPNVCPKQTTRRSINCANRQRAASRRLPQRRPSDHNRTFAGGVKPVGMGSVGSIVDEVIQ